MGGPTEFARVVALASARGVQVVPQYVQPLHFCDPFVYACAYACVKSTRVRQNDCR